MIALYILLGFSIAVVLMCVYFLIRNNKVHDHLLNIIHSDRDKYFELKTKYGSAERLYNKCLFSIKPLHKITQ